MRSFPVRFWVMPMGLGLALSACTVHDDVGPAMGRLLDHAAACSLTLSLACTTDAGTDGGADAATDAEFSCVYPESGTSPAGETQACQFVSEYCCAHPACLTCEGRPESECQAADGCSASYGVRLTGGAPACEYLGCRTSECGIFFEGDFGVVYALDTPANCFESNVPPPMGWAIATNEPGSPCAGVSGEIALCNQQSRLGE